MKIEHTFITDSKDLYALVYMNKQYHLFHLDLDKINLRKFNKNGTDEELNNLYKIDKPILIFDSIKNKKLTQMHVRGSSRKEAVDFSQKLVILFLFED